MTPFFIDKATQSDVSGICELIETVGIVDEDPRTDYSEPYWAQQRKEFFSGAIPNEKVLVVVARSEDSATILACGVGVICDDEPQCYWIQGNQFGYIRYMRTAEKYRNQGIGTAILNEIMKFFDDNGIVDVQLHASQKGQHFYAKHGFHIPVSIEMWRDPPVTEKQL